MKTFGLVFVLSSSLLLNLCVVITWIQIMIANFFLNGVACYRDIQAMFSYVDRMLDEKQMNDLTGNNIGLSLNEAIKYHQRVFQ